MDKLLPGEGELKGIRDMLIKLHAPIHWLHVTWVKYIVQQQAKYVAKLFHLYFSPLGNI